MTLQLFAAGILVGLTLLAQTGDAQQATQTPATPPAAPALRTPPTGKIPDNVPPAIARFLKQRDAAKTLSFRAQIWFHRPDDVDKIHAGQMFDVQIRRPNLFAVHVTPCEKWETQTPSGLHITYMGCMESASISDGKSRLTLLSTRVGEAIYYVKPTFPTYRESDAESLQRIIPDAALVTNALADFVPAPDETIGLTPVVVYIRDITLARQPKAHEDDEVLYFAKDTGELIRWSLFDPGPDGKRTEYERVEYGDWKFNPHLPASTFSTKPPPGAILAK